MKKLSTFFLSMVVIYSEIGFAQKAVLIEEGNEPTETVISERPWSQPTNTYQHSSRIDFQDVFALRAKRRVGVGASLAGQLGLIGAFAELNFTVEDSTIIGFGTGGSYNSMTLQWKHTFDSDILVPYVTIGYSRWFSGGQNGSPGQASPSFLSQKLLSDSEKLSGRFGKDLLIPSAGLQYYIVKGPSVGTSVFAEVMLLISPTNFESSPTGSMGMLYYF